MERSLIILKPDAIQRQMVGKIITRFEEKGLKLVGMKLMSVPEDLARKHYAVHQGKPFYEGLVRFVISSPVVVMAVEGINAIAIVRKLVGATFGSKAEPGTIRGDFGVSNSFNLIHASDAPESAQTELALWFKSNELCQYKLASDTWIYDFSSGKPE